MKGLSPTPAFDPSTEFASRYQITAAEFASGPASLFEFVLPLFLGMPAFNAEEGSLFGLLPRGFFAFASSHAVLKRRNPRCPARDCVGLIVRRSVFAVCWPNGRQVRMKWLPRQGQDLSVGLDRRFGVLFLLGSRLRAYASERAFMLRRDAIESHRNSLKNRGQINWGFSAVELSPYLDKRD